MEINKHPKDFDRNLTKSTIKAIEKLAKAEAIQRVVIESMDSVERNNGNFLNKTEQLDFFKGVYKYARKNGACKQMEIFKAFYESGNCFDAWSILLGNIEWLEDSYILSGMDLPKQLSIGKSYFDSGEIDYAIYYNKEGSSGVYIGYHLNGQIERQYSFENKHINGEFVVYNENGQIKRLSIFQCGKMVEQIIKDNYSFKLA